MAGFDMGQAWNEATKILSRDGVLIGAMVAGGAIAGAIIQFGVFGFSQAEFAARITALSAGGTPDPMAMLTAIGSVLAAVLAAGLLSGAASMGATRMTVAGSGNENIGGALLYGLIATITTLAVYLVGGALLALAFGLVIGLLAALGGGVVGGILAVLIALTLIPLTLWLVARLFVQGPAMAAARSVNPLYGIAQSWMLTRSHQWPIIGYLVLLIIAGIVVSLLLGLVGGLFGGVIGGSIGEALTALMTNIPIGIISVAVVVGMWRHLAPDNTASVFE